MKSKINIPAQYNFRHPCTCDVIILAAGFEDRAFYFISHANFKPSASCILIKFENSIQENLDVNNKFRARIDSIFSKTNVTELMLTNNNVKQFEDELRNKIAKLPRDVEELWIEISGMPTFIICSSLNICRSFFSNNRQSIVYTSARDYYPSKDEISKLEKKYTDEKIEYLPKSMAREMAEVLILEAFSGHRSNDGASCLAVFAGYEVHRSAGVIESTNPSMLLLLYGDPGAKKHSWRLELSKNLHRRFETTRKTAIETVSTLNLQKSLDIMEKYYNFLFEDYDFTIAPVCSKMQVVATYLFWERYKEVQLVFPLPIGYQTELRPKGSDKTYVTLLETRNSLYHHLD